MDEDSFSDTVDTTLRGKYVRVHSDVAAFEGWVNRIAPDRGSIVLYDATNTTTEESIGSVFLRTCEAVEILRPTKRIKFCALTDLNPYPHYQRPDPPSPERIQLAHRNNFAGGFPVVRENGTILAGHKYVAAADAAGLEHIPAEIVAVSDEQAAELFRLAHDGDEINTDAASGSGSDVSEQTTSDDGGTDSTHENSDDDDDDDPVYGY